MGKARSTTNRTRFKVGDLVKVADWCLNKGLTGVVTKVKPWSASQDVWAVFPVIAERSMSRRTTLS